MARSNKKKRKKQTKIFYNNISRQETKQTAARFWWPLMMSYDRTGTREGDALSYSRGCTIEGARNGIHTDRCWVVRWASLSRGVSSPAAVREPRAIDAQKRNSWPSDGVCLFFSAPVAFLSTSCPCCARLKRWAASRGWSCVKHFTPVHCVCVYHHAYGKVADCYPRDQKKTNTWPYHIIFFHHEKKKTPRQLYLKIVFFWDENE